LALADFPANELQVVVDQRYIQDDRHRNTEIKRLYDCPTQRLRLGS
jgi:hypothetical protein